ncbi:DUF1622 domain-containing protein [Cyanobium sp. LEGE 06113]|uniref:DUF1622 domain-containing protein n=1 Tax=Cyanobium sp. LEGE 06113 TaxID=1297573 RepID=UPI001882C270|nr:DUF1622 domain-containing protein [Cyanobium sp. LEGE 06113]MBE9154678.1 DUF1622 domain-containing protein [Cyanobium sp. LEGE 06113]
MEQALLESALEGLSGGLRLLLEGLSVVTVGLGLALTLGQALRLRRRGGYRRRHPRPFNSLRLTFGSWLSLALEFQLAADIVATTTAPSNENLIQLAVVAVIRTFLNVFLAREVEAEQKLEDALSSQDAASAKALGGIPSTPSSPG